MDTPPLTHHHRNSPVTKPWQDVVFGTNTPTPAPAPGNTHDPTTITDNQHPYIAAAVRNETQRLATTTQGSRNHALNTAALKLAQLPASRDTIRAALIDACHTNGLIHDDGINSVTATIKSAFTAADQLPTKPIPDRKTNTAPITDPHGDTSQDSTASLEDIEHDFWTARPHHTLIYTAALSRMTSPWAVLACCAARTLACIPPSITLPPIIGGQGSLNWFAAITAKSGGGKGAAMTTSGQLITEPITIHAIGSGEGMIETYRRSGEPEDAVTSVMFSVDEIDSIAAMRGRTGQTTMTVLRQGFSGERLGFSYRGRHTEHVEAHTYRMTLVAAVQPGRAGALFDDQAGGTPQRFMWFPGRDKRITAHPPAWPTDNLGQPATLTIPDPLDLAHAIGNITIPDIAADTIRTARAQSMSGDDNALDGHTLYCREKFAYFLAVIDGRTHISDEDWRLSGIAAAVSDWCRDKVRDQWLEEQKSQSRQRGALRAVESDEKSIIEQITVSRHLARITDWIVKTLAAHGPITPGELNRKAAHRDRVRLNSALLAAGEQGIIGLRDGRWSLL